MFTFRNEKEKQAFENEDEQYFENQIDLCYTAGWIDYDEIVRLMTLRDNM